MRNNWIKSHPIREWIFPYYDYHKTNSSIHFRRFVAKFYTFIIDFFHDFVFHNIRSPGKQKAIKSYFCSAFNNISEPNGKKTDSNTKPMKPNRWNAQPNKLNRQKKKKNMDKKRESKLFYLLRTNWIKNKLSGDGDR